MAPEDRPSTVPFDPESNRRLMSLIGLKVEGPHEDLSGLPNIRLGLFEQDRGIVLDFSRKTGAVFSVLIFVREILRLGCDMMSRTE